MTIKIIEFVAIQNGYIQIIMEKKIIPTYTCMVAMELHVHVHNYCMVFKFN